MTPSLERVYGLDDYQLLGFLAIAHYIRQTNDLLYARKTRAQWVKQLSWLASNINSTSGLADLGFIFLGAAQGGSLGSCATVETLNAAADIAEAISKKTSSEYHRSSLNDHDIETKISPNTNGLFLRTTLAAEDWGRAAKLIYNVWGAMLKDPETRSGAGWEYLTAIGQPGLGAFTSLGHPWGGGQELGGEP
ncbi:alpha-L-rhamnosidase A [Fusarium coicis]|nr:alpha-L-rhamnosidase A [Fusarium coicis]